MTAAHEPLAATDGRSDTPSPPIAEATGGPSAAGPAGDSGSPDRRVRVSISPVYGAVGVAINMMSMLTLITYTLLPLPGQRSIGWWNYIVAAAFFVASLVLAPLAEAREARLQAAARPH